MASAAGGGSGASGSGAPFSFSGAQSYKDVADDFKRMFAQTDPADHPALIRAAIDAQDKFKEDLREKQKNAALVLHAFAASRPMSWLTDGQDVEEHAACIMRKELGHDIPPEDYSVRLSQDRRHLSFFFYKMTPATKEIRDRFYAPNAPSFLFRLEDKDARERKAAFLEAAGELSGVRYERQVGLMAYLPKQAQTKPQAISDPTLDYLIARECYKQGMDPSKFETRDPVPTYEQQVKELKKKNQRLCKMYDGKLEMMMDDVKNELEEKKNEMEEKNELEEKFKNLQLEVEKLQLENLQLKELHNQPHSGLKEERRSARESDDDDDDDDNPNVGPTLLSQFSEISPSAQERKRRRTMDVDEAMAEGTERKRGEGADPAK